jgi:hypothetical protein
MIAEIHRVELCGGPSCGRELDFQVQPPEVLLVEIAAPEPPPALAVHAYERQDEKTKSGRVVYLHLQKVGEKGGMQP